ncbi:MAG: hypothetical protein IJD23_06555 [Spirochaetaceae bacterium]|nr:hypothetical protein [Spirochaetaceae bacterium]
MTNRPSFLKNNKKKICLICEGYEEFDYISKLLELKVWADVYDFTLVNAESNGNISARYQDKYQSNNFDIVLAFCDTDRKPHDDFNQIRKKINGIFGIENAADEVIIFVNPCSMQVELLHFENIKLRTQNKNKNASEIERLTGIKNYKAKEEQRKTMCNLITKENYEEMKKNLLSLATDYKIESSTNFGIFLKRFEDSKANWIYEINKKLGDY